MKKTTYFLISSGFLLVFYILCTLYVDANNLAYSTYDVTPLIIYSSLRDIGLCIYLFVVALFRPKPTHMKDMVWFFPHLLFLGVSTHLFFFNIWNESISNYLLIVYTNIDLWLVAFYFLLIIFIYDVFKIIRKQRGL